MADAMTFPKTIKEFIDQYSFKDSDEVYTNGSILIPTFRVEQAIEHYEQEIRNNVIDEFANRLYSKIKAEIDNCADELDWIDEIAEQMKGGAE